MRIALILFPKMERYPTALLLILRAVLLAVCLLAPGRHARGQSFNPGAPLDLTRFRGNEVNPSIAINPTNPSSICVASVSDASNGLMINITANQGVLWTSNFVATPASSNVPPAYGYPSLAWDSYGNLYLAYLPATYEGVAVAVSTNSGKSFSFLTNLASADATATPCIATGPATAPGSVWVVYKDYSLPSTPLVAQGLLATNLGASSAFGPALTIPGSASGGFPAVAIGPAGQVMVAFQNNLTSSNAAKIFVSVNTNAFGTNGFGAAVTATSDATGGLSYIPAQSTGVGVSATPGLAWDVDPYSAYYGRAYLIYSALATPGGAMNIGFRYSTNKGATWHSEATVNDDFSGNSHFMPRLAVDPATGIIASSWYDCRNDQGDSSTVITEMFNSTYTFNNLFVSNFLANSNGIQNPSLSIVTNGLNNNTLTIIITADNLWGTIVATDGVANVYVSNTTGTASLDLNFTGATGTNAAGTNFSVSLLLEDFFTDAFTSGNGANQEAMMYATISTNGGASFMPNKSLIPSSGSNPINPNSTVNPPVFGFGSLSAGSGSALGFGNYTGLVFSDGNFYCAWADNSDVNLKNPGGPLGNFDVAISQVVMPTADFSIYVTNTPNPVLSDSVVAYSVVVHNAGPSASTCVVTDDLPANVTFESVVPAVGATSSINGNVVVLDMPNMNRGVSLTNLILVTASYSAYGTNFAIVSSPLPDTVPTNNTNTLITLFAGEDLALGMSASATELLGGEIVTNTLYVTNLGPAANGDVIISNLYSPAWAQITVLSAGWAANPSAASPGTYSISSNLLVLNLGQLAAGTSTNILVSALALATSPTGLTSAYVYSLDYDTNLANNGATISSTMIAQTATVGVSSSPANPETTLPMTFTINVTNFGPSSYGYLMVTNILPTNFTSITVLQSPNPATNIGSTVIFPVGPLASNQTTQLIFTAVPQSPGTFTDTAVVSAFDYVPNFTNSAVFTVVPLPPAIENFRVIPGASGAIFVWDTPASSTGQVAYGLTPGYGAISSVDGLSTHHVIMVSGLLRDTSYYFDALTREQGALYTTNGVFGTTNTLILNTADASYSGFWTASTVGTGIYGNYYQSANTTNVNPTSIATYTPVIPVSGNYNVSIWYPQSTNYSTNTQVSVSGATSEVVVSVNQTTNGGGWQPLAGDIYFTTGTGGNVAILNDTGETNKAVVANAIRWVYDPAQDTPTNGAIPAWWANFFFGTNIVSASADADGDGYPNYAEYVFGTDPTNAASKLNFAVTALASNLVSISFSPWQGGRNYQLLSATNLYPLVWTPLTNTATVDTNGNGVFTVTQPSAVVGFYLLSAQLAP